MRSIAVVTRALFSTLVCLAAAGCSSSFAPETGSAGTAAASHGVALKGSLYGGQQPIANAHLYMYAAGTSGYGGPSLSLIQPYSCTAGPNCFPSTADSNGNEYLTTDANGSFYFAAGEYACSAGQQVYLYSLGGNPGFGANASAGLLAVLGTCGSDGSFSAVKTGVVINEVSTVAAAYALAGYATDATDIANASSGGTDSATSGASAKAATALANAFAGAANLFNINAMNALAMTPSGGTAPQAKVDSIADALAACINSDGTAPACTQLFSIHSKGSTGDAATDTATLAIYIAQNAGSSQVTNTVLNTVSNTPPFEPTVVAAHDLSLAISYPIAGMLNPTGVAIDGVGNIVVIGSTGRSNSNSPGAAVELGPDGSLLANLSTGAGSPVPLAVAIDAANNVWLSTASGSGATNLVENTSGSDAITVGSGLLYPDGLAFDLSNDLWVADGNSKELSRLNSSGSPLITFLTSENEPRSVALDTSNTVWVAGSISGQVERYSQYGTLQSNYNAYSQSAMYSGLAIDGAGAAWVADANDNCFLHLTSTGTSYDGKDTCYKTGQTLEPSGIALDGLGNVLLADQASGAIEMFANSGVTPLSANGYTSPSLPAPTGIAVDGSGNVWVPSAGINNSGAVVVEFVGLAAPVRTPILPANLALSGGTLDTRP